MSDEILGYCGLYCGGCNVFQVTEAGGKVTTDDKLEVTCKGCNSGELTPWCSDCKIKNCCKEKGFRVCLECDEYPCGKITGFMNDPLYPYHLEVTDNMTRLKAVGLEQWTTEMDASYKCSSCGQKNNWFSQLCSKCGGKIKNGRGTV